MRLNFKIPNMKFKKIKMDGDEIMKEIDVEKLKKEAEKNEFKPIKKRNEPYDHPNYKTVKEFFYKSSKNMQTIHVFWKSQTTKHHIK